jgi:hypothetical protein
MTHKEQDDDKRLSEIEKEGRRLRQREHIRQSYIRREAKNAANHKHAGLDPERKAQ